MNLLQWGNFKLHAGGESSLKIECDALTDEDWGTAAEIVRSLLSFQDVHGIATGGTKFAEALKPYRSLYPGDPFLIVDDVWTTGQSMIQSRTLWEGTYPNILGIVLFARADCPQWVNPIFFLHPALSRL